MIKRRYSIFLLTVFMSMVGVQAFAAWDTSTKIQVNGKYYYLDNDNNQAQVTSMPSGEYTGDITIPSSFTYNTTNYSVTSIGQQAFSNCSGLTSITIPNSVTSIGNYAFEDCSGLTSVTIPNGVTYIGITAFAGCSGLTSITIPNSVTSIGAQAFLDCSSLTSIVVENENTKYDSRNNCNAIIEKSTNTLIAGCKNTIIPNNVTSIGFAAFEYCSSLTSITIPNSVKSIGIQAFDRCSGLTSITIPNSVTSISSNAFAYCSSLASIVVEDGNTKYDSRGTCNAIIETASNTLIAGCKNTIIPNSVTSIGDNAFGGCYGLTSVTIPNSVTSIGSQAFGSCTSLTLITIPNSVTFISNAFLGCSGLTSVTVERSEPVAIDSHTFSNRDNATLYVPNGSKAAYEAANYWEDFKEIIEVGTPIIFADANVKAICVANWDTNGDGELCYAEAAAVTNLGLVFKQNTQITSFDELQYFTGLTSIGQSAFNGCSGLTSVTIPNSVTIIGNYAFAGCNGLTSITIPNSVTSIGDRTFAVCSGLTSVTIGNSVTSIGECTFGGCSGLTSITIPNSVTRIDSEAFIDCSSLTSVTIPNSVTRIDESAFVRCTSLTSITIPNSVTSIDATLFIGCSSLTSIVVENGNTKYDSRNNCNAIIETNTNTLITGCKNTIIPNNVTSIGNNAFYGCSSLTSITIPNSVTSIGVWAFYDCSGLTSVTVERSEPVAIVSNTFSNRANATLFVPNGSKTAYEAADFWQDFKEIIEVGTPITFADSNVKAICVANWDINHDGELSTTEAAAVTNLGLVFKQNTQITSFDELQYFTGLTSIYSYAFSGCSGLTSVTIPNSVTSIVYGAFGGCSGLTSVTIPNSVTSIGSEAFRDCSGLESVTIGNSVTSIVYAAFAGCSGLTSVTIPNSVTNIGTYVFDQCSGLESVTIGNSVTSIGGYAFQGCSGLTSITIPSSVTSIDNAAFAGCSGPTTIVVENGNTTYDSRNNCNAIIETASNTLIAGCKNTVIPNNVTSIGDNAFFGCTGLTSITIPNSVTSIGISAFQGCSGLTSVTIPNSVTSIGDNAFYYYSLTSVTVERSEPVAIASNTFSNRANATLYVPAGTKAAYQAANYWKDFKEIVEFGPITFADANVKSICVANWDTNGDGELSCAEAAAVTNLGSVFKGNTQITSFDELQYFTGLTSISYQAFQNCSGLTSVTIPNSMTSIDAYAFDGCSGLTSITIPNSVTTIGSWAFGACSSFTSITIPNSVTSIGYCAFGDCSGLTSIVVENGNTKYDSRNNCNAIIETSTNTLIAGCKNTIIPNDITSIGDGAFCGSSGLTSITIPNSVTEIGEEAFYGCSGLTSITIPNSVTEIGEEAFYGCSGLTSITIPNSVTEIGEGMFEYCSSLTSIVVGSGNTKYDSRNNCNAIIETSTNTLIAGCKNTIIPNSVTRIAGYAFYGRTSLTSITIPNCVKSLGNYAFYVCTGLTSITIPNSVTSIGNYAFSGCSGLTSVTVDINTPLAITESTFSNRANATLYVPKGSKAAYEAADYWKEFKEIKKITLPTHKLTYVVDGQEYKTYDIEEEDPITPETAPTKEGYTFSGWSAIPSTMPAQDVTITGSFTVNKYKLIYQVDGVGYKTLEIAFGSAITPEAEPTKETYLFSGWSEIPGTMPAHDVTVTGTFERHFTVAHVVKVINFIMNSGATPEDIALYDVNNDNELNIGDIILIVKNILNQAPASVARLAARRASTIVDFTQYTAAQFELKADNNADIKNIRLVNSMAQTHQLMYQQMDANTYNVVIFSMSNLLMRPKDGCIIEVDGGDAVMQNILVATPLGETCFYQNSDMPTGIRQQVDSEKPTRVYDLRGNRLNGTEGLRKGVYIINGKKVVVR